MVPQQSKGLQKPRRRIALFWPGYVETGDAVVAISQGQLGDLARRLRLPHGGEQLPDFDLLPARPTRRHPLSQAVTNSFDGLRQGQAFPQMLFRCPASLPIDDAIGGQVLHELGGDPAQIRRCLHDRDGLIEGFQIAHQGSRVGRLGKPPTKIISIVRRQPEAALGGQFDDRLRPQRSIKMIMKRYLRKGLQRFQVDTHDGRRARSPGPKAWGSTALIGRIPDGVSTRHSAPPCSQSS